MEPREIRALLRRGFDLDRSGQRLEAMEAYDTIRAAHPAHPVALSFKAGTLASLERNEEALSLMDAAILSDPDDPGRYWKRARHLYRLGFFRKAIPDFVKAKALDDGCFGDMPSLFLADCWFHLGDYKKSREVCAAIPDDYSCPGFRYKSDGSKRDILADIERVERWQIERKRRGWA